LIFDGMLSGIARAAIQEAVREEHP
jgi:hypothetical protein